MRDALLVLIILVLFVASIRNLYISCLTYWWFSIFRPQDWAHGDITVLHLPLLATAIFFIGSIMRRNIPFVKDKICIAMVLFYILGAFSTLYVGCDSSLKPIEPLEYLAFLLLAVFFTVRVVNTFKQLIGLIFVVTFSLGFYSGKGGLHALISGGAVNYGAENLGGTFTGSNAYAMGTAVLVFFMIFFYRNIVALCRLKLVPQIVANYKTLLKMLFLLIIIGSIYNVVSLFSRGSAISLFCGFVTLFFLTSKKLKATFLVIPLTLILLVTIPIPDNYKERIASAFSEKEDLDSSAASRPYFWGIANSIVQDYPTGVGFNCYRYFYNYYRTGPADGRLFRDVHSSHFNALADAGYAGAAVWLSIFLFSFVRLLRLRRSLQGKEDEVAKIYISLVTLIICSQVVFVLGGSFYTLTYMDLIWWIWGLTLILTKLITKHQPISDKALS